MDPWRPRHPDVPIVKVKDDKAAGAPQLHCQSTNITMDPWRPRHLNVPTTARRRQKRWNQRTGRLK